MIPLRVKATNYGPYESVDWEIPPGLTALVGNNTVGDGADSNGSGKTKLLELVPICLFGPSLPWSEYLTRGAESTVCRVELEFEHSGNLFRVRRTYDAKGRGKTTLDLEIQHTDMGPEVEPAWEPLSHGDQKETQALIEQTIGLSEDTFAHSVFAAQGARHFADPSLAPRERKAILTEALNLGVWDKLAAECRAEMSEVKSSLDGIAQRLGAFEEDLARKDEVEAEHAACVTAVADAEALVSEKEVAEQLVREKHDEAKAASTNRAALTAAWEAADRDMEGVVAAAAEVQRAITKIAEIDEDLAVKGPLAATHDELATRLFAAANSKTAVEQALRERDGFLSQATQADARAATAVSEKTRMDHRIGEISAEIEHRLNGHPGECDHCGQALAGEALEKAIASLRLDMGALELRAAQLADQIRDETDAAAKHRTAATEIDVPASVDPAEYAVLNREAESARHAVSEVATLTERRVSLQRTIDEYQSPEAEARRHAVTQALADANAALAAAPADNGTLLDSLVMSLGVASSETASARQDLSAAQAALAVCGERLRNLTSLAERSQEALAERARLQGRLDVLVALGRAYGRDGIPALILEVNAIPHIENEAQRVMEELGMPFRVELVTQRENKTGGLKDTLDVVVHEPNGSRRYETYSGGERTRLEMALRIALARLIAHQSSSHCGLLALDEPSFLDGTGLAALASVLRSLTEFRSIVLVSHDERLVEAFDQVVVVTRDESGSKVGEAT